MMSGFFLKNCDTKYLRQSTYKDLFLALGFGDSLWVLSIWGYGEPVHHGTNI